MGILCICVFSLHIMSFDRGEGFELSLRDVGLLQENAITTGWRFEMREQEVVREWEKGGNDGDRCVYRAVAVFMEIVGRLLE